MELERAYVIKLEKRAIGSGRKILKSNLCGFRWVNFLHILDT